MQRVLANGFVKMLAVLWFIGLGSAAASAATIAINPVNETVNGTANTNVGKIDANTTDSAARGDGFTNVTMDATFTLTTPNFADCTTYHWVQVVTALTASATNPTYNNAALVIPVIDTPSGGYDTSVGEDNLPWYLTLAQEATLNSTAGNGDKLYETNDTPGVKGAKFDTWLVREINETPGDPRDFGVIAGFRWTTGTKAAPRRS